ncbi:gamma carbonic anhydrase family protein [Novosphingobium sp.]|uniref:gamma carbonic anhydrase family protein n=1 Tax=Novosphingobium sp. TaxID=1874826 RepID=UPI00286A7B33|nr:gamma carbonic anhydrase family protein [Novosphingobium sp.]
MHRPDTTIMAFGGKAPRIHDSAFIAPGCRIIGDVEIGPDASIWYNCVLRGDVTRIVIGARSNVQDGTVIHCDGPMPGAPDGFPTLIGDDVLIGHMAMLHGTVIEDRGFVGFAAQTMNGCVIEREGMLAAGALLAPGKRIPARQLWSGRPATFMRDLDDRMIAGLQMGVGHYVENARRHAALYDGQIDGTAEG